MPAAAATNERQEENGDRDQENEDRIEHPRAVAGPQAGRTIGNLDIFRRFEFEQAGHQDSLRSN